MRLNMEGSDLIDMLFRSKLKIKGSVQTLGGTYVIPADGPPIHFLDPGGAARNVDLPAEEDALVIAVFNEADAAEAITLRNDAAGTVVTIAQSEAAIAFCGPDLAWRHVLLSTAVT